MNYKIRFNIPTLTGNEASYILKSLKSTKIAGDAEYSKKCQNWFEDNLGCPKVLLTPSCTAAIEMSAILLDIKPGDEVIMPSYTFVSTANAFVLRGAKIIFVDIRPDTMNIDEKLIESAITLKTKAIVVVHYAGVGCEMEAIMRLAKKNNLYVVEDAAQGVNSTYKNKKLGTFGHFGTYSFHETKNITSGGEGGLLIINDKRFLDRAEVIREKGTNRSQFFRGSVNKYSWIDIGSSYLMNEISAAYLWGNIQFLSEITNNRLETWKFYYMGLKNLEKNGYLELPSQIKNNGHMFYIKVKNLHERTLLLDFLKEKGILATFHYIPLHSSDAGKKLGEFHGEDKYTTAESERLIRLPIYYKINKKDLDYVIKTIEEFFLNKKFIKND